MPLGFSDVRISNMALELLGRTGDIESMDERSPQASAARVWYDVARLAVLEAYNWSFARKYQTLAEHSEAAPENRWAYRYQWPSDCVAPRLIENPAGPNAMAIPFEVEEAPDGTPSILTDLEDAVLIYTHDQQDPVRFSMHATLMMATQLAVFMCQVITGKQTLRKTLVTDLNSMAFNAPATDGSYSVQRNEPDALSIQARL